MTIKVLEHNGIYTAYRRVVKRSDDGQLYESVKRIDFPFPPPDETQWPAWAVSLTHDALDAGLQIFFDKWNFGNGSVGEGHIYQHLCDERERRKLEDNNPGVVILTGHNAPAISHKKDPDSGMFMTSQSKLTFAAGGTMKISGKK